MKQKNFVSLRRGVDDHDSTDVNNAVSWFWLARRLTFMVAILLFCALNIFIYWAVYFYIYSVTDLSRCRLIIIGFRLFNLTSLILSIFCHYLLLYSAWNALLFITCFSSYSSYALFSFLSIFPSFFPISPLTFCHLRYLFFSLFIFTPSFFLTFASPLRFPTEISPALQKVGASREF